MCHYISYSLETSCRSLLLNNEVFIESLYQANFDMVVIDSNVLSKCHNLIPHRLRVPFVTYTDANDPFVMRVPWLPSFVPGDLSSYSNQMSFVERLNNIVAMLVAPAIPDAPTDVINIYRRLYGNFKSLDQLAAQSSLWLLPREHVVDYAKPTNPNIINLGGLTVRQSTTTVLPTDLRMFIAGARRGTILVSFGSLVSTLPKLMLEKFLNAFRELGAIDGFRFVFRLKNVENIPVPENVMISDWVPQNDLLANPAIKLFITHCGNNGQYEAVYHGVPMIGFPVFTDQPFNARRMEHKGFGISMDIHSFTSEELVTNVRRIVFDRFYKERVVNASATLRDDPQGPIEKAAYWIEYVCRFGGSHLRSTGHDLPLYAYLMLDVLAFCVLFMSLSSLVAVALVIFFLKLYCMEPKVHPKSKEKPKENIITEELEEFSQNQQFKKSV